MLEETITPLFSPEVFPIEENTKELHPVFRINSTCAL